MIKVNDKMLKRFLNIMEDYGEYVFGNNKQVKQQLEICLNSQGYWSGNTIRVYFDADAKDFYIESRF